MNVRQVNANLLVALDALLEKKSVSHAAQSLGLSQPAMSNALARLRELFDDRLLVRVGHRMTLTPRAEAVAEAVRAGVMAFDRALSPPAAFDPSVCQDVFRLVMTDLVEWALLPRLLELLHQRAPQASVQLHSGGLFEVPAGLASGDIDAMVGYYWSRELGSGYRETDLWSTRLVCIARRGHPLVRVVGGRAKMSKKNYERATHVLVTQRRDVKGMVDEFNPDLRRKIGARVPHNVLVPKLVAQSDLVAAVDIEIADAFGEWLPIQQVDVPVRMPKGTLGMVWHERTHDDPSRRFLRALVVEASSGLRR